MGKEWTPIISVVLKEKAQWVHRCSYKEMYNWPTNICFIKIVIYAYLAVNYCSCEQSEISPSAEKNSLLLCIKVQVHLDLYGSGRWQSDCWFFFLSLICGKGIWTMCFWPWAKIRSDFWRWCLTATCTHTSMVLCVSCPCCLSCHQTIVCTHILLKSFWCIFKLFFLNCLQTKIQ